MKTPLPCPFCGKAPFVGPTDPKRDGGAHGYVECRNRDCVTHPWGGFGHGPKVDDGADVCDDRGSAAYKALAVWRWNDALRAAGGGK